MIAQTRTHAERLRLLRIFGPETYTEITGMTHLSTGQLARIDAVLDQIEQESPVTVAVINDDIDTLRAIADQAIEEAAR